MNKIFTNLTELLLRLTLCCFALLLSSDAWAVHEKTTEERIEHLSARIEDLEKQLEAGQENLDFLKHITFSGLLEVEAGYSIYDPKAAGELSERNFDIVLATVELGIDTDLNENISGHISLLYEEDETEPMDIDEGFITVHGGSPFPWAIHAGKMYVPFGRYDTFFVSDPLTLELGETRESAVLGSVELAGIDLSAGIFNGDAEEKGKTNDNNPSFVLSATCSIPDGLPVTGELGVSVTSNLADSDSLQEEISDPDGINDPVLAYSAFISTSILDTFEIVAETVYSADKFSAGELNGFPGASDFKPKAFNVEAAYRFATESGIAVKLEKSDDCGDFIPEKIYGASAFHPVYSGGILKVEYLMKHYENKDTEKAITAQLSYEF